MKKCLSLILTVAILICTIPIGALTVSAATGGQCGDNAYWTFNPTTRVLNITGSGAMDNKYDLWTEHKSEIRTVYIKSGITSIADDAFAFCEKLYFVEIPDTVKEIGAGAFTYCRDFTALIIPEGVKTIKEDTFYSSGLQYINLPDSVTVIEERAFGYCYGIGSVNITKNVKSIASDAFSQCHNLNNITVESGNTVYTAKGNCLIEKATKKLILGCNYSEIPNDGSVEEIGDYAFNECVYLTYLELPNGLKTIGEGAFFGCYNLMSVYIPSTVTSIGAGAFRMCNNLGYISMPDGITHIGKGAFEYTEYYSLYNSWENNMFYIDQYLLNVDMENVSGVIEVREGTKLIAAGAFSSCEGVTNVIIPETVEYINDGAFESCTALSEITIPSSVTDIGDNVLLACYGLESINVASGNDFYHASGNCLIETQTKTLLAGCKNSVIPNDNSVEIIGDYAFSLCEIQSVTIPESVVRIGEGAFAISSIVEAEIVIPNSVKSIGTGAFMLSGLQSVSIGKGTQSIGEQAFAYCTLENISVDSENEYFSGEGNNIIDKTTKTLIKGTSSSTIPNGIATIGDFAFLYCVELAEIIVPDSVKVIGEGAFGYCVALSSIKLPDSEIKISGDAFYQSGYYNDQSNWESGHILYIGSHLITTNSMVEYIEDDYAVKDGTKTIGDMAFLYQYYLKELAIPQSVTHIGDNAFEGCSELILLVHKGSYAHQYAVDNNMLYRLFDGVEGSWRKLNGKWWYRYSDATWAVGWAEIDNKWYYFNSSGYMQTGWLKQGNTWYYLSNSGAMVTDWVKISGKWYYFNGDGKMLAGWQQIDGSWYYMNASGAMVTGWLKQGNTWYYLNNSGEMVTDWAKISGKWYYFNGDGKMQTGWIELDGVWYYLNSSGAMVTGTQKIGGKTYKFNTSGAWIS